MAADEMEDLADRYADRAVRSVFIYTREAHPGENYRHHLSMDDKRSVANAFKEHSNIRREVLLDDLEGTAHKAYGTCPNMTWIVGRGGFIHYKSTWTAVEDVEDALINVIDFQENRAKNQCTRNMDDMMAGLERTGPQAVEDFVRSTKKRAPAKPAGKDTPQKIPGSFFKEESGD